MWFIVDENQDVYKTLDTSGTLTTRKVGKLVKREKQYEVDLSSMLDLDEYYCLIQWITKYNKDNRV
ncbi:MAG: hypothetical protein WC942_04500 [Clostridia bacterium]|jgi:hypothetical protein